MVDNNVIGLVQYMDSTRINLGLFQHDINVFWDLVTHDLSICLHLMGKDPLSLMASDFIFYITTRVTPVSDGKLGVSVAKILEAAQKSIKQHEIGVLW